MGTQAPASFDRVRLKDGTELTHAQWIAIALPTRVKHVLERTVQFYAGDQEVHPRVALKPSR